MFAENWTQGLMHARYVLCTELSPLAYIHFINSGHLDYWKFSLQAVVLWALFYTYAGVHVQEHLWGLYLRLEVLYHMEYTASDLLDNASSVQRWESFWTQLGIKYYLIESQYVNFVNCPNIFFQKIF
jgi:hypothetical protein